MKQIIVINGTGGCGKDTFVDMCKKYAKVFNFSSIDKVKEIAKLIGWDGSKTERDRKFLADLKQLTTNYNDMPYNSIVEKIDIFNKSDNEIMFLHIREPIEIQRIVNNFDAVSLLIKRENYDLIKSNDADANVEKYDYDYIIINDELEKLDKKAEKFIKNILEK